MKYSKKMFSCAAPDGLIDAALLMYSEGANVIPAHGKRPILKTWKQWQTARPTVREIRDWFDFPNATAIACVLGPASNNLVARDFDNEHAYEVWAGKNLALSRQLPTAATSRGAHVYFYAPGVRTIRYSDGELRGLGSYVIAPPSVHADGTSYRWINEFSRKNLIEVDPDVFAERKQLRETASVTERTEKLSIRELEDTNEPQAIAHFPLSLSSEISHSIQQSQPRAPGQRHNCLFELARRLKAVPTLADATPVMLEPIFNEWHRLALPVIRTKCWDESWAEFLYAWSRVRIPYGQSPIEIALNVARDTALTPAEAKRFRSESVGLLYKLCRELQRCAGTEPFFLSCAEAEKRIGLPRAQVHRQLQRMILEGTLMLVESHTRRRATRYRFLPSDFSL